MNRDGDLLISAIAAIFGGIALLVSLKAGRLAKGSALSAQLGPQLEKARDYLGSIVALGGAESLPLISTLGTISSRLEELAPGISDAELGRLVANLQASITGAFRSAPGHGQLGSTDPSRIQRQTDAARAGEKQASDALKRLSILQSKAAK